MAEHHPVEILPPDIAPYRTGNSGVDFVHVFDSGRPRPIVMVQALTHGNEFCGAHALTELLQSGLQPQAGRLIIAFANVDAFARFDFDDPDASRCIDEDYNRVWADDVLFGPRDSVELRRARALQPFVETGGGIAPDLNRRKEPLEAYPLENLRMVGTLQQKKSTFALIRTPDNNLFRVRNGNYLGQNFGRIEDVSEAGVKLKELVQDAAGDWTERISTLQLAEETTPAGGRQ